MVKAIGAVLFLILLSLSGCGEHNDIDREACALFCVNLNGGLYGYRSDTGSGGYCACFWKMPKSAVVLTK